MKNILKKIIKDEQDDMQVWQELLEEAPSKYLGEKLEQEIQDNTRRANESKVKIEAYKMLLNSLNEKPAYQVNGDGDRVVVDKEKNTTEPF